MIPVKTTTLKPKGAQTPGAAARNAEYIARMSERSKLKKEQEESEKSQSQSSQRGFVVHVDGANAKYPKSAQRPKPASRVPTWTTDIKTEQYTNLKVDIQPYAAFDTNMIMLDVHDSVAMESLKQQRAIKTQIPIIDCGGTIQADSTQIVVQQTFKQDKHQTPPANTAPQQMKNPVQTKTPPQKVEAKIVQNPFEELEIGMITQEVDLNEHSQDESLDTLKKFMTEHDTAMKKFSIDENAVKMVEDDEAERLQPLCIPASLLMLIEEMDTHCPDTIVLGETILVENVQDEAQKEAEAEIEAADVSPVDEQQAKQPTKKTEFFMDDEYVEEATWSMKPNVEQPVGKISVMNTDKLKNEKFETIPPKDVQKPQKKDDPELYKPNVDLMNSLQVLNDTDAQGAFIDLKVNDKIVRPGLLDQFKDDIKQQPQPAQVGKKKKLVKKVKKIAVKEERASNLMMSLTGVNIEELTNRIMKLDKNQKKFVLNVLTRVEAGEVDAVKDIKDIETTQDLGATIGKKEEEKAAMKKAMPPKANRPPLPKVK